MLNKKTFTIVDLPDVSDAAKKNITMGVRKVITNQSRRNKFHSYKKEKLVKAWDSTTTFEKVLMMFLSEFKTLSTPQIQIIFTIAYKQKNLAYNGMLEVFKIKYNCADLSTPISEIAIVSKEAINRRVDTARKKGLIDTVRNHANNLETDKSIAPCLSLSHHFLTEFGTQVMAAGTGFNKNEIGFVPNYKTYAFNSLLHLSESNDFFVSTIAGIQDLMNNYPEQVGTIDVVRWENEKNSTHHFEYEQDKKIMLKPDGYMILFSTKTQTFTPYFLEHDVGSTTKERIRHKTNAYLKYVMYMRGKDPSFRKPILLFVTSHENKVNFHKQAVKTCLKKDFSKNLDYLNNFGRIAITTTELINENSPVGKIWKVFDLKTGELTKGSVNLLSLGWKKEEQQ